MALVSRRRYRYMGENKSIHAAGIILGAGDLELGPSLCAPAARSQIMSTMGESPPHCIWVHKNGMFSRNLHTFLSTLPQVFI